MCPLEQFTRIPLLYNLSSGALQHAFTGVLHTMHAQTNRTNKQPQQSTRHRVATTRKTQQ